MSNGPATLPHLPLFAALLLAVAVLLRLRTLHFASLRLGIGQGTALVLLLASLLGSALNLPIWQLPEQQLAPGQSFRLYGLSYVLPHPVSWPGAVLAVNVGGALIPTLLSLYLLAVNRLWVRGLLAIAIVSGVSHLLATPVPGAGIAIPAFIPPLVTAIAALVIAPGRPAPVAYAAGSLGTLIGADLMNLGAVESLGTPFVAIGGAGTFDAIFLNGILAVLLASLTLRRG